MIDTKAYYDENKYRQPRLGLTTRKADDKDNKFNRLRPDYDEDDEFRDSSAGENIEGRSDYTDPYRHFDDIDPYNCESLEPEQYLICDYKVWACVLKTRQWGKVTFCPILP